MVAPPGVLPNFSGGNDFFMLGGAGATFTPDVANQIAAPWRPPSAAHAFEFSSLNATQRNGAGGANGGLGDVLKTLDGISNSIFRNVRMWSDQESDGGQPRVIQIPGAGGMDPTMLLLIIAAAGVAAYVLL